MTFSRRLRIAALSVVISSSLFGCEDDLPKATLIAHMRVLGARTEVVGDETRSTPRPGEKARMTWNVVYPEFETDQSELSSLFLACTAPASFTGNPVCQELIDIAQGRTPAIGGLFGQNAQGCDEKPNSVQTIAGIRLYCVSGTPQFDLTIDKAIKTTRLVQGIICRGGTPALDLESPVGVSCWANAGVDQDDVESIAVYGTVDVATDEDDENANPDIDALQLVFGKARRSWNPTAPEFLPELIEDCSKFAQDVVLQSRGFPEVIEVEYPRRGSENEDIVLSNYATFGELSRRFTVFEDQRGKRTDEPDLTWELSEEERSDLLDKPKLVRFYFTVLDGRGGFDITTRELCIYRP